MTIVTYRRYDVLDFCVLKFVTGLLLSFRPSAPQEQTPIDAIAVRKFEIRNDSAGRAAPTFVVCGAHRFCDQTVRVVFTIRVRLDRYVGGNGTEAECFVDGRQAPNPTVSRWKHRPTVLSTTLERFKRFNLN